MHTLAAYFHNFTLKSEWAVVFYGRFINNSEWTVALQTVDEQWALKSIKQMKIIVAQPTNYSRRFPNKMIEWVVQQCTQFSSFFTICIYLQHQDAVMGLY